MAADYTVESQRQTTSLSAGNTFTPVMEVTFAVVPSGTIGKVEVPLNQYNAENVKAAIEARVAQIKAVEAL